MGTEGIAQGGRSSLLLSLVFALVLSEHEPAPDAKYFLRNQAPRERGNGTNYSQNLD